MCLENNKYTDSDIHIRTSHIKHRMNGTENGEERSDVIIQFEKDV